MEDKMISARVVVNRMEGKGHLDDIDDHVPFGALGEIKKVLTYGDLVYPGVDWMERDIGYHIQHAQDHLNHAKTNPLSRDESGCYHLAHAAVRLMFALAKSIQEEYEE